MASGSNEPPARRTRPARADLGQRLHVVVRKPGIAIDRVDIRGDHTGHDALERVEVEVHQCSLRE